ncbi:LacI family DNA-binding transcriptional regulator [Lachnoclostridium sp. An181]|uniref:LacI family DNA-binding transcriptional regulator n=1 Tax=Lachnoclostridium sp. An181 TaxID=1965575 RepID=UPI0013A62472|nr:LacI family DNA-binding transcriptional regulator [Lachnoclostridium sp. An181]
MTTIKDIAKEAGVSFTTVSNVIHGNTKKVSKATIEKINRIMEEKNYVPNMGARMLVQNQSRIIGVISNVLSDAQKENLHSPFGAEILGAIEKEIQKLGYYMMLYATENTEEIEELISKWNVDGIITIGIETKVCRKLGKITKVPAVYTDCYFEEKEPYFNVGTKDEEGAYGAVRYLIGQGHTKIGYVADESYEEGKKDSGVGYFRYQGYLRAMKEAGIEPQKEWLFWGHKRMRNKEEMFEHIYRNLNSMTALAFCYDYYAIEAMDFLRHKGVKIPEDISVIGFDDIDMARLVTPRLTTMKQGVARKGQLAVEVLMNQIQKKKMEKKCVRLPVALVERESVKQLK